MSLTDLLSELRDEASHLTMKSLPPLGLDYRGRTKIERLVFAILKEYCTDRLGYELGGVTRAHQRVFDEASRATSWTREKVGPVLTGLQLSEAIRDIASSDPYVVEDRLEALGTASSGILLVLEREILRFVEEVESRY